MGSGMGRSRFRHGLDHGGPKGHFKDFDLNSERERETPGGFLTGEVQSCEWVLLAGMRRDYRGTRVEAGGTVRDQ